ncbi:MAG TPA: hypothetical protein DCL54_02290 [Alphaproteobacteria bacterium]|nr:hypothetical protein [Alphaproteobacteria bacterium]HAJ45395.1 hypothetical protein [Alphaproteobacteria bacterium]
MSAALSATATTKLRFENADVVVFDPVSTNRSASRGALATLGFRKVQTPYDPSALQQRMKGQTADLLLLEMRPDPAPILGIIQDIRQGRLGLNPFVIIIATAWTLDDDIVKKVVQSGADDLMGRPFSIGFLGQRIRNLLDGRKGFVVTSDYVGPDRRRDPGRTSSAATFTVPNSLKLKATGGNDTIAIETEIASQVARSRDGVNAEKSRRNAFQMIIQARLTSAALDNAAPAEMITADLVKIETLAQETVTRTQNSEFSMAFQMCEPIVMATQAARRGEEVAHHLKLIGQLATTLYSTLCSGRSTEEIEYDVTQTVLMIQNRSVKAS